MLMKMEIKMRMHRRIAVRNGGKPREDLPELVFAWKKSEMARRRGQRCAGRVLGLPCLRRTAEGKQNGNSEGRPEGGGGGVGK